MANLALLKPKVRTLAEQLIAECKNLGHTVIVTQTLRTIAEQNALYAQGRTTPGKIVTNARGGYSLHNFGVAFDICPLIDGKAAWNDLALFKKIGVVGVKLGLEWGGTWTSFVDLPHYQYLSGYTLADFRNNKVDGKKFDVTQLKVTAKDGLNVRTGPGVTNTKIGKLNFGDVISPLEKNNGWVKIVYKDNLGWVSELYVA